MKKILAMILASAMVLALAGCGNGSDAKSEGVMTYAEYKAAALETKVTVETYVQAKQGWWEKDGQGLATIYTQDHDGAYFIYEMPCTKDEYDKLTPGTKIKVVGYKAEWSGEVEIADVESFEIEKGSYVAKAVDLSDKLASADLVDYQNQYFSVTGLTVEKANDDGAAFLYNWDGSGSKGNDLYFNVSKDGKTYTFTVESYLCGQDTDVYKAVEGLKVGSTIDVTGYLYWYNGANPHITSVKVK
ncbi:MAG: hypothetical protein IKS11_06770 [Lachnospiraceae bacterium]|jgi:hypothetical protein|nr:hypothetical protein [Lachnospiraceae bacterium]